MANYYFINIYVYVTIQKKCMLSIKIYLNLYRHYKNMQLLNYDLEYRRRWIR